MNGRPQNWKDIQGTITFLMIFAILGLVGIVWQQAIHWTAAFLMALAAMACGAFVGFLFGLPRTQPSVPKSTTQGTVGQGGTATPVADAPAGAGVSTKSNSNTNLEEIADWLTKILLGAGLTQLGQLPKALESMAATVTPEPRHYVIVIAVWIFFIAFGFFLSYLMTRLFVAGALVAVDNIIIAGTAYSPQDAVTELHKTLSDLQDHVVQLTQGDVIDGKVAPTLTEQSKEPGGLAVKALLWVDHQPPSDPIVKGKLESLAIKVSVAQRSESAQVLASNRFDRIVVVADSSVDGSSTFTDFVSDLVGKAPTTPVVVFCDSAGTATLKSQMQATSVGVTSSGADLLALLELNE